MKNKEKLAQMSDRELGEFINCFDECPKCRIFRFCNVTCSDFDSCAEVIEKWLGEEADGN